MTASPTHDSFKKEIQISWSPPPVSYYKLNTDGAFIKEDQTGGVGRVVRDPKSNWVIVFYKKICIFSHTLAELQDLELGLQLALDRGTVPIEVETDSTEVIELHHSRPTNHTVLDSCRSLLKSLGNPVSDIASIKPTN